MAISVDQKYFTVILVKELLAQVNEVAAAKTQNMPHESSLGILKELSSILKELSPELQEHYLEITLKLANKAQHPGKKIAISEDYVNASLSANRKLIAKIRASLVEGKDVTKGGKKFIDPKITNLLSKSQT